MQTNNTGRCTNWKTSRHLYHINDTKPCRQVSQEEKKLEECLCPACRQYKLKGLKIGGMEGFCNRATHNLWILLEEARLIEEHLYNSGNYKEWYKEHLDNTIYRPLITQIVENLESSKEVGKG